MQLVIVMPAYNESSCIEATVRSWVMLLDNVSGRLIVVNDGSKDETGEILTQLEKKDPRLLVVHQPNSGHGTAVLRGYERALELGADYVFQTDSDSQFEPADSWKLWNRKDSSPFIVGNRKKRSDALHRKVITRIMRGLNILMFGYFLNDANIPFRLMKAKYLAQLLKRLPNQVFAPNIFLTILAKKDGCDLLEIPVSHLERKTGTVSIVRWKLLKICLRCLKELLQFRRMISLSERPDVSARTP